MLLELMLHQFPNLRIADRFGSIRQEQELAIHGIEIPALLMIGENDQPVTPRLAEGFDNFEPIRGAGHFVCDTHAHVLVERMRSFLAGAETTMERYACPPGVGVELWIVHGGRHTPGSSPGLGELAWSFLRAHPKPDR